jgi:hypothetical protein
MEIASMYVTGPILGAGVGPCSLFVNKQDF